MFRRAVRSGASAAVAAVAVCCGIGCESSNESQANLKGSDVPPPSASAPGSTTPLRGMDRYKAQMNNQDQMKKQFSSSGYPGAK